MMADIRLATLGDLEEAGLFAHISGVAHFEEEASTAKQRFVTISSVGSLEELLGKPVTIVSFAPGYADAVTTLKVNDFEEKPILFPMNMSYQEKLAEKSQVQYWVRAGQPYVVVWNGVGFALESMVMPLARTDRPGIVQLSSRTDGSGEDRAATEKAVGEVRANRANIENSSGGFSAGLGADSYGGGAIGRGAFAAYGGAIGELTYAYDGFAGGQGVTAFATASAVGQLAQANYDGSFAKGAAIVTRQGEEARRVVYGVSDSKVLWRGRTHDVSESMLYLNGVTGEEFWLRPRVSGYMDVTVIGAVTGGSGFTNLGATFKIRIMWTVNSTDLINVVGINKETVVNTIGANASAGVTTFNENGALGIRLLVKGHAPNPVVVEWGAVGEVVEMCI